MSLHEFMHPEQHLSQEPYLLLAWGLALACVGSTLAVLLLLWWMVGEMRTLRQEVTSLRRQRQDYQALHQELRALLEQASQWNRRTAALYPSLADLLDDKLAMLSQSNGHHET